MPEASPTTRWRASWIWARHASGEPNAMVLARRSFSLSSIPQGVRLLIAADTFYRLHVNGRFVARGPARSEVFCLPYDEHDVTTLLREGENVIALEVNGLYRPGGVLVQLEDARGEVLLTSDDAWRAIPSPSWKIEAPFTSIWDHCELTDGRAEPPGWTAPGFSDSAWPTARVKGPAATPPYYQLEPRPIPFLDEQERFAESIYRVGEAEELEGGGDPTDCGNVPLEIALEPQHDPRDCAVEGAENLLSDGAGAAVFSQKHGFHDLSAFYDMLDNEDTLPTARSGFVVLDFGRMVNGYFRIDVEGEAGNVVDIAFGQTLTSDGKVMHMAYSQRAWGAYADRYVLRDGRQQWETFHWRNFRYAMVIVRRLDKPLKLHAARVAEINHGEPMRGRFACSDETLTTVWDATTRTMRLCFTDYYMDNPFREKGIWSGDVSVILLGAYAALGDIAATRHYLRMFARAQHQPGFFPGRIEMYPKDPLRPDYIYHNMQYVLRVIEYFDYGVDRTLATDLYPALRKFALWVMGFRNAHGIIENVPMNRWIDWAPVDLRGAPLVYNLLVHAILQGLATIARAMDRPGEADEMLAFAAPMPAAMRSLFWHDERGLFVDCVVEGEQSATVSEHANYTALAVGIADDTQRDRILPQLADPPADMVQVEPSYMYHPLQALFGLGEATQAMDFMRKRYGRLFRRGADTLWEEWSYLLTAREGSWRPRYRSRAQGAGCCPSWFLSTEVLGIKPLEPGFARILIRPQHGDLDWAEGILPAPAGDIAVRWAFEGDDYTLTVTVPEGAVAEVVLPEGGAATRNGEALPDSPCEVAAGTHEFRVASVTRQ